jgi:hypothetical protein
VRTDACSLHENWCSMTVLFAKTPLLCLHALVLPGVQACLQWGMLKFTTISLQHIPSMIIIPNLKLSINALSVVQSKFPFLFSLPSPISVREQLGRDLADMRLGGGLVQNGADNLDSLESGAIAKYKSVMYQACRIHPSSSSFHPY